MTRFMSPALALTAILAVSSASAGVVENGRLPDGIYECTMASGSMVMMMGNMRIQGLTYQGPAFDNKFTGTYPYIMSSKVVLWKGPLGGLSSGGNSVISTVVTNNDPRKASYNMIVHSQGGNDHDVSCSRPE